jgi:hypothetical protein
MTPSNYQVSAQWHSRLETPAAIATRFLAFLSRLGAAHPGLAHWHYDPVDIDLPTRADPAIIAAIAEQFFTEPLPSDPAAVASWIASRITEPDLDGIGPASGYRFSVINMPYKGEPDSSVTLYFYAGATKSDNFILFITNVSMPPDLSFYSFQILREVVLAMADTFDVDTALAYCSDLGKLWMPERRIGEFAWRPAWLSYAGPRYAPLVAAPPSVYVEHTAQGGILLAATSDQLDTTNPAHLAAAQDIAAAGRPFYYDLNVPLRKKPD